MATKTDSKESGDSTSAKGQDTDMFEELRYSESEPSELKTQMRVKSSADILQFVLRLMKDKLFEKAIQVLDTFRPFYDINHHVNDTFGTKVCILIS